MTPNWNWTVSEAGASCTEACTAAPKRNRCNPELMGMINQCIAMSRVFPSCDCAYAKGSFLPAATSSSDFNGLVKENADRFGKEEGDESREGDGGQAKATIERPTGTTKAVEMVQHRGGGQLLRGSPAELRSKQDIYISDCVLSAVPEAFDCNARKEGFRRFCPCV